LRHRRRVTTCPCPRGRRGPGAPAGSTQPSAAPPDAALPVEAVTTGYYRAPPGYGGRSSRRCAGAYDSEVSTPTEPFVQQFLTASADCSAVATSGYRTKLVASLDQQPDAGACGPRPGPYGTASSGIC